ncbi:MAG: geranylgeranylglyceryl/heptaprenylglyceryl phosphate synthase [Candidatus Micrarchaeia archaeon]
MDCLLMGKIEKYICDELGRKKGLLFAVIDPLDYKDLDSAVKSAKNANEGGADIILVGGSTGVQGELLDTVTKRIKEDVNVPVVLFPGNIGTVTKYADALYFMSMLNSKNTYWITRAQMLAAPTVKQYGIEPLPVGYIVVEPGGTVGWVGEANLIPRDKPKLAAAMALGAQYMGFRFIITDAGSNPASGHIPLEMVKAVSSVLEVPYVVAGGIKTPEQAKNVLKSGADIIQVGTAFEESASVQKVREMVKAVREGAKLRTK